MAGRLPDPARLVRKQNLEIKDVEGLFAYAHRYGTCNSLRILWLLARLQKEAKTEEERVKVEALSRAFVSRVDLWPKREGWLEQDKQDWKKDKVLKTE
jgi:hypothetical protein